LKQLQAGSITAVGRKLLKARFGNAVSF